MVSIVNSRLRKDPKKVIQNGKKRNVVPSDINQDGLHSEHIFASLAPPGLYKIQQLLHHPSQSVGRLSPLPQRKGVVTARGGRVAASGEISDDEAESEDEERPRLAKPPKTARQRWELARSAYR